MKKTFVALMLAMVVSTAGLAAQSQEGGTQPYDGNIHYRNVVVYKVFDHRDVVIVLYAKHGKDMGQLMIPKSWSHTSPRKLDYRILPKGLNPYMSIVSKDGEFHKVILTLPHVTNPDSLWTVANPHIDIGDAASLETLEFEY